MRRVPPGVRGYLLIAAATVFAAQELYLAYSGWFRAGIDFLPLRHAAESILAGGSVFSDPLFVYPPTAAVVLLPTALGTPEAAFGWWVAVNATALLLAGWLICRVAGSRNRRYVFALAVFALLGGVVASRSLSLGNLSELLVPLAVGVLVSFSRGRWVLGCALLAASLLLKPMLAPLVLIPVWERRWAELAKTMLPAGALLVVSMAALPGGWHFPAVLRYCLSGTNLHGTNAVNNLSLRGWAEGQHAPGLFGALTAIGVLLAVTVRIMAAARGSHRMSPVWLANVLLLGTFLAGSISEVHFLLTTLATTLLYLVQLGSPRVWLMFVPGIALLALPMGYVSGLLGTRNDLQTWFVAGELLLLAAFMAAPAGVASVAAPRPVLVLAGS